MKKFLCLVLVLLTVASACLLSSCGGKKTEAPKSTETPTATETPKSTETPTESVTPTGSATPTETETQVVTDTPVPTVTPVETDTPLPTETYVDEHPVTEVELAALRAAMVAFNDEKTYAIEEETREDVKTDIYNGSDVRTDKYAYINIGAEDMQAYEQGFIDGEDPNPAVYLKDGVIYYDGHKGPFEDYYYYLYYDNGYYLSGDDEEEIEESVQVFRNATVKTSADGSVCYEASLTLEEYLELTGTSPDEIDASEFTFTTFAVLKDSKIISVIMDVSIVATVTEDGMTVSVDEYLYHSVMIHYDDVTIDFPSDLEEYADFGDGPYVPTQTTEPFDDENLQVLYDAFENVMSRDDYSMMLYNYSTIDDEIDNGELNDLVYLDLFGSIKMSEIHYVFDPLSSSFVKDGTEYYVRDGRIYVNEDGEKTSSSYDGLYYWRLTYPTGYSSYIADSVFEILAEHYTIETDEETGIVCYVTDIDYDRFCYLTGNYILLTDGDLFEGTLLVWIEDGYVCEIDIDAEVSGTNGKIGYYQSLLIDCTNTRPIYFPDDLDTYRDIESEDPTPIELDENLQMVKEAAERTALLDDYAIEMKTDSSVGDDESVSRSIGQSEYKFEDVQGDNAMKFSGIDFLIVPETGEYLSEVYTYLCGNVIYVRNDEESPSKVKYNNEYREYDYLLPYPDGFNSEDLDVLLQLLAASGYTMTQPDEDTVRFHTKFNFETYVSVVGNEFGLVPDNFYGSVEIIVKNGLIYSVETDIRMTINMPEFSIKMTSETKSEMRFTAYEGVSVTFPDFSDYVDYDPSLVFAE